MNFSDEKNEELQAESQKVIEILEGPLGDFLQQYF